MVLAVTQFLTSKIPSNTPNRPIFTSIPNLGLSSRLGLLGTNASYRKFWQDFRTSPEVVATLSIPITDIMGDRPEWVAPDGKELGRNTRMKAERFWRDNRGKETIKAFLYDALLTGDGYIWKGKATEKQIKEAVDRVSKFFFKHVKLSQKEQKTLQIKAAQDEDLKKPKIFDYVASSTMDIIHDNFEIQKYIQSSNGITSNFTPEEIIHYRFMTINGQVRGFSPVESLAAEIALLTLVKGNMEAFLRNGGSPDKAFILPKEIANSNNHKFLIEQLQTYKKIRNRHGNLVFTGEINIEDLQGNPKDLEYKDLALYITSNIAYAYGIPVSRIPYLIGTSAVKGDSGGLSEAGYWNRISDLQNSIEDLLNSQMFEAMGWHIRFPRKYKQDEVREAQTASMNADTVTKYQSILKQNNLQLTQRKILNLLNFSDEDIEAFEMSEEEENRMMNQNMLPNNQLNFEPDKQKRNQTKRNVANQKGSEEAANA